MVLSYNKHLQVFTVISFFVTLCNCIFYKWFSSEKLKSPSFSQIRVTMQKSFLGCLIVRRSQCCVCQETFNFCFWESSFSATLMLVEVTQNFKECEPILQMAYRHKLFTSLPANCNNKTINSETGTLPQQKTRK